MENDITTVTFRIDEKVLSDFDLAARLNHRNRSVQLRETMMEFVKKTERQHPDAFRRGG